MSNVYDAVNRERFLRHRTLADPGSADIISELVRHNDESLAELSRIRGLLEREKLSNVIHSAMYEWMHADVECGESTFVADKLREYLGGGK